jgi:hypothetical protein
MIERDTGDTGGKCFWTEGFSHPKIERVLAVKIILDVV